MRFADRFRRCKHPTISTLPVISSRTSPEVPSTIYSNTSPMAYPFFLTRPPPIWRLRYCSWAASKSSCDTTLPGFQRLKHMIRGDFPGFEPVLHAPGFRFFSVSLSAVVSHCGFKPYFPGRKPWRLPLSLLRLPFPPLSPSLLPPLSPLLFRQGASLYRSFFFVAIVSSSYGHGRRAIGDHRAVLKADYHARGHQMQGEFLVLPRGYAVGVKAFHSGLVSRSTPHGSCLDPQSSWAAAPAARWPALRLVRGPGSSPARARASPGQSAVFVRR